MMFGSFLVHLINYVVRKALFHFLDVYSHHLNSYTSVQTHSLNHLDKIVPDINKYNGNTNLYTFSVLIVSSIE